jgi:hypothetical protein
MEKESSEEREENVNHQSKKVRKKCRELEEQTPDLFSTVFSGLWFIL